VFSNDQFRVTGNIINRRELVLGACVKVDAQLLFKSITVFHTVLVGQSSLDDEIARHNVEVSGKKEIVELFSLKCRCRQNTAAFSSAALDGAGHLAGTLSTLANSTAVPERSYRLGSADKEAPPSSSSTAARDSDDRRVASHDGDGLLLSSSSAALRREHGQERDGEQPLKKGWLLKKRDIISGWKCR
jgi:hypothetical protein